VTTRRTLIQAGISSPLVAWLAGAQAQTQTFPSKPMTLAVGFGPGGGGDIVARRVAQKISEITGQPMVVENRPGAGNAAAAQSVLQAKHDGHAMLLTGNGSAISSVLFRKLPYDLNRDFRHVSSLASFDLGLIVDPQSRFNSIKDVLAFAKASPGKLSIGTSRVGSTQHLAAELFKSMAGIDAISIPYKTTGDMLTAIRAGDVPVAFEILSPILGQIKGKSVKVLAVTAGSRFPGLPDVPTLSESGLPGFEAASWAGVSVPADTPTSLVMELSRIINQAVAAPDVQQSLQAVGYIAKASTPEEMAQRIRQDATKWKTVIEKSGIPLE